MTAERFLAAPALALLKIFQRRTVDYVFDRLYGTDDPVRQFLVADEVGPRQDHGGSRRHRPNDRASMGYDRSDRYPLYLL